MWFILSYERTHLFELLAIDVRGCAYANGCCNMYYLCSSATSEVSLLCNMLSWCELFANCFGCDYTMRRSVEIELSLSFSWDTYVPLK